MNLVLLNLREMCKSHRFFFALIIIVQAVSAFCLAFIIGVIINNRLFLSMDYYQNNISIYFNKEDEITYDKLEGAVMEIAQGVLKSAVSDIRMGNYQYDYPNTIWTDFRIEDGKYVNGRFFNNRLALQLAWGRTFTESELNSRDSIAIAAYLSEGALEIEGEEFEIIGERAGNSFDTPAAIIPPRRFYNIPITDIRFSLNRYISAYESERIAGILDEATDGRYEIDNTAEATDSGDIKAVMRSSVMACVLIGFVLLGTMAILYGHIIEKRKYKLAVCRLTGCSASRSIKLFLAEVVAVSVPSVGIGYACFYFAQKKWLEGVYPYMEPYLNAKAYALMFLGLLGAIFISMLALTVARMMHPIKRQLAEAGG